MKLNKETLILSVLILAFGLWALFLVEPSISGQYVISNSSGILTVNTTVNITNSAPLIIKLTLDSPIDLTAYNTTRVYCNLSTYDYDNDTLTVNATFYRTTQVNADAADDGNNHYTNTSCRSVTDPNPSINWTCAFDVQYYADNASDWRCNATVSDSGLVPATNLSSAATLNPLIAIRMGAILDYGELAVGQISNDTLANITNAGNRDVNISVRGYADTDNDGYAFNCTFGAILIDYEKYHIYSNTSFINMYNLTGTDVLIPDFSIAQRISETNDSFNSSYWKVEIPVGAGGVCNGKLVFTASDLQG